MSIKRIYLDNCCLSRPWDNQDEPRIRLETEAMRIIFLLLERGASQWISSAVVLTETHRDPNDSRRENRESLLGFVDSFVVLDEQDLMRAQQLQTLGFGPFDAQHIVAAEKGRCDVLLTTDDRLMRVAKRHANKLRVALANPIDWLKETTR